MTQLSRKELAEIIINGEEWSDQDWTNTTGISRQTFWRMRTNKIKGVESKTIELMARASGRKVIWKDHSKTLGKLDTNNKHMEENLTDVEHTLLLYRETIQLQKEKIKTLETKLSNIVNDYASGLDVLLHKEILKISKSKEKD